MSAAHYYYILLSSRSCDCGSLSPVSSVVVKEPDQAVWCRGGLYSQHWCHLHLIRMIKKLGRNVPCLCCKKRRLKNIFRFIVVDFSFRF